MIKLSNFFYKKSSLLIAVIITILTFSYLFFVMMDVAKCFEIANSTQKSLGTSFGLTLDMVNEFFSIRSKEMILCYKAFNSIWDNLFALLYGFMYITWLSFIFKPFSSKVKYLNLIPLLQVIFDWLENYKVVELANSFLMEEQISAANVKWVSIFSMGKWGSSMLLFIVLFTGIIIRIIAYFRKRKVKN